MLRILLILTIFVPLRAAWGQDESQDPKKANVLRKQNGDSVFKPQADFGFGYTLRLHPDERHHGISAALALSAFDVFGFSVLAKTRGAIFAPTIDIPETIEVVMVGAGVAYLIDALSIDVRLGLVPYVGIINEREVMIDYGLLASLRAQKVFSVPFGIGLEIESPLSLAPLPDEQTPAASFVFAQAFILISY